MSLRGRLRAGPHGSIRFSTREADMGLEVWREITTEYDGRAIKGSFKFVDGRVDVRTRTEARQRNPAVMFLSE